MKIVKYIVMGLMLASMIACEDFIDIQPQDQIGVTDFFKTANDVQSYVVKFYASLPSHGRSSGMPGEDADSDNMILATPNSVMDGTRAPRTGQWTNEWGNIRSLNILFDNINQVTDPLSSYQHYLGEAHFFKAWFYFNLLNTYGDVPWYTNQLLPGDEDLYRSRDSRVLVADSILANIDKAIQYLDTRSRAGNARLNKEAALAFKTRVALFEGTWQKYHAGSVFGAPNANPNKYFQAAVEAAEELISGNYTRGIYSTGNPDEDYYKLFGMDNMSSIDEILLYRVASSAEGLGHELQFYTTRRTQGMSVTWWLVTSYLGKDGNPYDYLTTAADKKGNAFLTQIADDCDPRLKSTVWIPGDLRVASSGEVFVKPFIDQGAELLNATGFQVKKFSNPNSSAAGADYGANSETGYILFRYAEVLLNYAEAKYELDGTVAVDVLNELRSRAGMPAFTVFPQSAYGTNLVDYGYSVSDELYAIRNERRVELALEGRRGDDYRRWAAHGLFQSERPLGYPFDPAEFPNYNPPLDPNGLIDFFADQLPSGYGFKEGRDYLTSIPEGEIVLNPKLEQNPGW